MRLAKGDPKIEQMQEGVGDAELQSAYGNRTPFLYYPDRHTVYLGGPGAHHQDVIHHFGLPHNPRRLWGVVQKARSQGFGAGPTGVRAVGVPDREHQPILDYLGKLHNLPVEDLDSNFYRGMRGEPQKPEDDDFKLSKVANAAVQHWLDNKVMNTPRWNVNGLMDWQPGFHGKGIIYNGQIKTWPVNQSGFPHHVAVDHPGKRNANLYIKPNGDCHIIATQHAPVVPLRSKKFDDVIQSAGLNPMGKLRQYNPFKMDPEGDEFKLSWTFESTDRPARVLLNNFRPQLQHPRGPRGSELPFIYDPGAHQVHLGPADSYHWELIQRTPELRDAGYGEPYDGAPDYGYVGHIHGRMEWPSRKVNIFGDGHDPNTVLSIKRGLGEPEPKHEDLGSDFDL